MQKREKDIFIGLCVIMFIVNTYLESRSGARSIAGALGAGFGISILTIPLWSVVGIVLSNIGIFFYKIAKPSTGEMLNFWQKVSLGVIAGTILEPAFGIFIK